MTEVEKPRNCKVSLNILKYILKYIFKEIIIPASANKVVFILAPIVTMTLALVAWAVIPMSETLVLADINEGMMVIQFNFAPIP